MDATKMTLTTMKIFLVPTDLIPSMQVCDAVIFTPFIAVLLENALVSIHMTKQ